MRRTLTLILAALLLTSSMSISAFAAEETEPTTDTSTETTAPETEVPETETPETEVPETLLSLAACEARAFHSLSSGTGAVT